MNAFQWPSALHLNAPDIEVDRRRLLELLLEHSYIKQDVTLSSGRKSDFYVDCKKTTLLAEGHWLAGRLLFSAIHAAHPEAVAVGGLTMGADPLASAVSLVSYLAGVPLDAFLIRKRSKGYGTDRWIEGLPSVTAGARVIIVEDVVTTGSATMTAIERAQAAGLMPVAAFALVDRGEGGCEAIASVGVRLYSLFTREDFSE